MTLCLIIRLYIQRNYCNNFYVFYLHRLIPQATSAVFVIMYTTKVCQNLSLSCGPYRTRGVTVAGADPVEHILIFAFTIFAKYVIVYYQHRLSLLRCKPLNVHCKKTAKTECRNSLSCY